MVQKVGKYVFGLGPLGAFDRVASGTSASGTLEYTIYDWGAEQKTVIKDFIDAFISGGEIGHQSGKPIKKQRIIERIGLDDGGNSGQITYKETRSINNNFEINFGSGFDSEGKSGYKYLMHSDYRNRYFLETYEKTNIPNNMNGTDGNLLKQKAEEDESEDKEYIYITYTLLP